MAVLAGQNCNIYLEFPDGRVMELPGMTAFDVSLEAPMNDYYTYDMSFIQTRPAQVSFNVKGIFDGDLGKLLDGVAQNVNLEERKHSPEWQCTYCGSVNLREHRKCPDCGANRSFLYGDD